ncbi:SEC10/PgrA surface exclusion domain-containing protein [Lactiplantibacillus garii]|uniref:SEC10/PgrA surface exclusion domain-containing protein n=1 Tax=Lactiplantibacillus garii TaxID=2306423 RepID=A0A3R8KZ76_9LACO|nr:SEC10/PgrA surface exclusion domain-containing protein [Lactiplantibacillus garii]RRK09391.1 SEC10/PgrA surface exclusion domain-containing protein [Lactiplantibacillus garii]
MNKGMLIKVVTVAAVVTVGGITPINGQASATYHRGKITKIKHRAYYTTKSGKSYRFKGKAKHLKLTANHKLKSYQKTTWVATRKVTLTKHGHKTVYYDVTNARNHARGWVRRSYLKAGRNFQMTNPKKMTTKRYVRAKKGKIYQLKGNRNYVKFTKGRALVAGKTYKATKRRTVYKRGKAVTYYYVTSSHGVKGWVWNHSLKAKRKAATKTPVKVTTTITAKPATQPQTKVTPSQPAKQVTQPTTTPKVTPTTPKTPTTTPSQQGQYSKHIQLSTSWIQNFKTYTTTNDANQKAQAKKTLDGLAQSEAQLNQFSAGGLSTAHQYNTANLPDSELLKLNEYFMQLVNGARTDLGYRDTAYVNTNDIAFAKDIAQHYGNYQWSKYGHDLPVINAAAKARGLRTHPTLNFYENLGVGATSFTKNYLYSEAELYKMIYDQVTNFITGDANSNYGHAQGILISANNYGLALAVAERDEAQTGIPMTTYETDVHVVSVTDTVNTQLILNHADFEPTYGITSKATIKPNAQQAAAQYAYNVDLRALEVAQNRNQAAEVAKLQAKLAVDRTTLDKANEAM